MLQIELLPILGDNYTYLLLEPETRTSAVVDPGEAAPVLAALRSRGRDLDLILCTHHHGDHVGGNRELKAATGATIVGPRADRDRIPLIDVEVGDGTPFGRGKAYSGDQLARRLDGHLFEPHAELGALFMPPTRSRVLMRLAVPVERLGLRLAPHFAGVVLVEAEKRIYLGTPLPVAEAEAKPIRRYVAVPRSLVAARRPTTLGTPGSADLPRAA